MREYVRRWINEWDLVRLEPDFRPSTEVTPFIFDYSDDEDLSAPMEEDVPTPTDDE